MAHYAKKCSAVQKQIGTALAVVRSASVDRSRAKWRSALGTHRLAFTYMDPAATALWFISASHFASCLLGLRLAAEQLEFPQCYTSEMSILRTSRESMQRER